MPPDNTPPVEPPAVAETQPMGRRHRRTVLRVILVTHLCLALLTGLAVVLVYRNLDGNLETLAMPAEGSYQRPEKPVVEGPKEPLNILVMGSDTRAGEGNAIDGESGAGGSDTTILIHVSADRQDAYGVSLPRDALVDRPDCISAEDGSTIPGEDLAMFNTAFSLGGPACTIQMMEKLTDIRIDHAVVIDFNGFVDMVDAVDGVTVCIPKEVDDPEHNIFFDAGTQTLSGRQALNYVRERTVLSVTGDIGRMKRQQAFIASMINKVLSAGTLTRPNRVINFLSAATGSLKLSEDLDSIGKLTDLALQFRDTGLSNIKFITVPFAEYEPDPNRLVWTDEAALLWKRIRMDEVLGPNFNDGSISASDPVGTPSGSPSDGGEETAAEQEAAVAAAANGLCS